MKLSMLSLESMPTYLCCSTCGYKQEAPKSCTVQEEGLTNEGMHHLLLLQKQAPDKNSNAKSPHVCIHLDVYIGWHIFRRKLYYDSSWKIHPSPSL